MNKAEYDYSRMLKQMEELQKKMADKKELIDKERDDAIISALRKVNASRQQGLKLAALIADNESFAEIMKLNIKTVPKKKRGTKKSDTALEAKESEVEDE